jgi:hypothetical protein
MSKLKKIMGIGAVVTVLFAAPITVINQPTPALSQAVQSAFIAKGSTPVGNTAWQQYPDGEGVFVDVDTSSAGFKTTPIYITSLGGRLAHWSTTGATSIYEPTPTGFRVYVRWSTGGLLTPAEANYNQWHINWIAVLD